MQATASKNQMKQTKFRSYADFLKEVFPDVARRKTADEDPDELGAKIAIDAVRAALGPQYK